MDQTNHNSHRRLSPIDLAEQCAAHLDREEAHLAATGEVLRRAYDAALGGEQTGMTEMLERHAQAADAMRQERESFRRQAGAFVNMPAQQVTLQALTHHMPRDIGKRLQERRTRLQGQIAETERLGRELALLSHYFLDFLKRFFIELTGGVKCGRYGPEGLRQEPACGSLLHARG